MPRVQEGLAEGPKDDAVLHERLSDPRKPSRLELSPYHYGQALWAYIGGHWGDLTAMDLFERATVIGVDAATIEILELTREELFTAFHASLREAYEPVLAARQAPRDVAEPLFVAERGARLNVAPALSPDGTQLAFLSSRSVFTIDLYLEDVTTGRVVEELLAAESDPHFDYLSYVDSSVDAPSSCAPASVLTTPLSRLGCAPPALPRRRDRRSQPRVRREHAMKPRQVHARQAAPAWRGGR
jgi:hypothetical protein